jgi:hypothetical protein
MNEQVLLSQISEKDESINNIEGKLYAMFFLLASFKHILPHAKVKHIKV